MVFIKVKKGKPSKFYLNGKKISMTEAYKKYRRGAKFGGRDSSLKELKKALLLEKSTFMEEVSRIKDLHQNYEPELAWDDHDGHGRSKVYWGVMNMYDYQYSGSRDRFPDTLPHEIEFPYRINPDGTIYIDRFDLVSRIHEAGGLNFLGRVWAHKLIKNGRWVGEPPDKSAYMERSKALYANATNKDEWRRFLVLGDDPDSVITPRRAETPTINRG